MSTQPLVAPFVGSRKPHDRVVATVCQECAVGCGVLAYVQDGVIVDIQGDQAHPVNEGRLCARGIAFAQCLTHPDRLRVPATRSRLESAFEAVDNLDKGIDLLADRLRQIKDRHGPQALRIGCAADAGLDFQLAAARFAALWGTPHVYTFPDGKTRRREAAESRRTLPSFHDWETAGCLFLVEADPAVTHPVAFRHVLEARQRGAKVVAADARFTSTLSKADKTLLIRPGCGNLLGLAILKVMLDEDLCDCTAITKTFVKAEDWQQTFSAMSLDDAVAALGISTSELLESARLLAAHSPVLVITGTRTATAESAGIWPTLILACSWDQGGGGWHPLGAGFPALDLLSGLPEEFSTAAAGPKPLPGKEAALPPTDPTKEELPKALICGGDCLAGLVPSLQIGPFASDLVVHFGAFPCPTRDSAHMSFAAELWPEREGLCCNDEGLLQWSHALVDPTGACLSGLSFWTRLAERLDWQEYFPWGKGRQGRDSRLFYQWLLERDPLLNSVDVEVLASGTPAELPRIQAPDSTPAAFEPEPAPDKLPESVTSGEIADLPLWYQSVSARLQPAGTAHQAPWIQEQDELDLVCIHPETAGRLAIENGDRVFLDMGTRTVSGRARITRMVGPGLVCGSEPHEPSRVLLYREGQDPQQAATILKEMSR